MAAAHTGRIDITPRCAGDASPSVSRSLVRTPKPTIWQRTGRARERSPSQQPHCGSFLSVERGCVVIGLPPTRRCFRRDTRDQNVDLRWGPGMCGARNHAEIRALVDPDAYGQNAEGRCARGNADRGGCRVRDASFRMSSIYPRRTGTTRRMGFGPDGDGVKVGRYG